MDMCQSFSFSSIGRTRCQEYTTQKKEAKTQKSVTFQLFLYSVFSNLLLKKKKTTFHGDFMNQKKTLEGIEELICDFHFFICHAFYAFRKTEK